MQLARMALCQLAFHCIFNKLGGWGGVVGRKVKEEEDLTDVSLLNQ